ncbi:MAG: hypothetical protein ACI8WB_002329 [Phenylobacterium sp.]|jgi:hypothetical protein
MSQESTIPVAKYTDPQLGDMNYQKDEDCWVGNFNHYKYLIAREDTATPSTDLLANCINTLSQTQELVSTLQDQKEIAKRKASPNILAELYPEFDGLFYTSLLFYRRGHQLRILALLASEADEPQDEDARMWQIEFWGDSCKGLSFYL